MYAAFVTASVRGQVFIFSDRILHYNAIFIAFTTVKLTRKGRFHGEVLMDIIFNFHYISLVSLSSMTFYTLIRVTRAGQEIVKYQSSESRL